MSARTGTDTQVGRRRDAVESRERLLRAAHELFSEQGYERTTVRDVGQRAQVDPAMIARYFGSKAALYLASLRHDQRGAEPTDLTQPAAVRRLLERIASRGPTPTLYAVVRPHEDAELQDAALEVLDRLLTEPARAQAEAHGAQADARLRAEVVTAALAGIVLSRTSGAFPALAAAPSADVAQLVADLTARLLRPADHPRDAAES